MHTVQRYLLVRQFPAYPHRFCVQDRSALQTALLRRIFARAISYIRRAITQTRSCPTWDEVAAARDLSLFVRFLASFHEMLAKSCEATAPNA